MPYLTRPACNFLSARAYTLIETYHNMQELLVSEHRGPVQKKEKNIMGLIEFILSLIGGLFGLVFGLIGGAIGLVVALVGGALGLVLALLALILVGPILLLVLIF